MPHGRSRRAEVRAGSGLGACLPALALLLASVLAIGAAAFMPGAGTVHIVVIAPPWYTAAQTLGMVGDAGGRFVAMGRYSNVVVATAEAGDPSEVLLAALHRHGAWLVLDAGTLRGCVSL